MPALSTSSTSSSRPSSSGAASTSSRTSRSPWIWRTGAYDSRGGRPSSSSRFDDKPATTNGQGHSTSLSGRVQDAVHRARPPGRPDDCLPRLSLAVGLRYVCRGGPAHEETPVGLSRRGLPFVYAVFSSSTSVDPLDHACRPVSRAPVVTGERRQALPQHVDLVSVEAFGST